MTALPNPFLSAASLQPVAGTAASSLSEVTSSVSDGEIPGLRRSGTEVVVRRAAASDIISNRPPDVPPGPRLPADASVSAGLSDSQDVPAQMQESKARHSGLACDDKKPGDTTQESRPAHPATALSDDDLYWRLRFADDPFTRDLPAIPDPHAFFNKIIEIDVWADDAPLFLKRFG